MTTIAFCGQYLAADTAAHRREVPSNLLAAKIDMCDGFAYGLSGSYLPLMGTLIAWHRAGAVPADFPQFGDGGMMVIELATRRVWVVTREMPLLDEEAAPFTAGSGGDVALGALKCNRAAMEAVRIASECDTHTNDTIDFIDLWRPEKGVQRWDRFAPIRPPYTPFKDATANGKG